MYSDIFISLVSFKLMLWDFIRGALTFRPINLLGGRWARNHGFGQPLILMVPCRSYWLIKACMRKICATKLTEEKISTWSRPPPNPARTRPPRQFAGCHGNRRRGCDVHVAGWQACECATCQCVSTAMFRETRWCEEAGWRGKDEVRPHRRRPPHHAQRLPRL